MAATKKPSGRHHTTPPHDSSEMSSSTDCVRVLLKLLADFGSELRLGNDTLRIDVVNTEAVDRPSSAARVYSCLQEHITKLQAVSESLKTLVEADSERSSTRHNPPNDAVTSSSLEEQATLLSQHHPPISEATEGEAAADDVMVQIRARKSEIERRISAFMERKQMEINENNVREFCNVINCNQENSCARTDAVFTPYPGFKSHVKDSWCGGPSRGRGAAEGTNVKALWKRSHRGTSSQHRDSPEAPNSGPSPLERLPQTEDAGGPYPGVGRSLARVLPVHKSPAQTTKDVPRSGLQPHGAG
ncbi:MAP3K12-binding inhibitory protein 1 [Scophthalmus maximus]|uniref:MAP3K12-binding inhibitory protein 1 n=1 Tax=Scophthalmus maximus TaxID=52904 RepID=A0A2U9CMX9_SCOMX|nr:MAP3K12-binding inhibitory protein 1 [Scophthalmus maximus]